MAWDPNAPGSTAQQDDAPPPTPPPMSVTSSALTDTQLRAAPVPVSDSAANATPPTTVAVGVAAVVLLAARTGRRAVLIQNVSTINDLYIGLGANPTVANGIKVKPGESFKDETFTGAVHGIASGAGTDVRVVEVY